MKKKSKQPYTNEEIAQAACCRCGKPAKFQWNACADGWYRPICIDCDIGLNRLALTFMNVPRAGEKMRLYEAEKKGTQP